MVWVLKEGDMHRTSRSSREHTFTPASYHYCTSQCIELQLAYGESDACFSVAIGLESPWIDNNPLVWAFALRCICQCASGALNVELRLIEV